MAEVWRLWVSAVPLLLLALVGLLGQSAASAEPEPERPEVTAESVLSMVVDTSRVNRVQGRKITDPTWVGISRRYVWIFYGKCRKGRDWWRYTENIRKHRFEGSTCADKKVDPNVFVRNRMLDGRHNFEQRYLIRNELVRGLRWHHAIIPSFMTRAWSNGKKAVVRFDSQWTEPPGTAGQHVVRELRIEEDEVSITGWWS